MRHIGRIVMSVVTLGFLIPALGACGGGDGATGVDGDDGQTSSASKVVIDIIDDAFVDPDGDQNTASVVNVSVGDTVVWEWTGSNNHSVTSGEGQNGADGDGVPDGSGQVLDSGEMVQGSYEFVPQMKGVWEYYCTVHPTIMYGAKIAVDTVLSGSEPGDSGY